jgi:hypothetical protein
VSGVPGVVGGVPPTSNPGSEPFAVSQLGSAPGAGTPGPGRKYVSAPDGGVHGSEPAGAPDPAPIGVLRLRAFGTLADGPVGLKDEEPCAPSHAAVSPAKATAPAQRNNFVIRVSFRRP